MSVTLKTPSTDRLILVSFFQPNHAAVNMLVMDDKQQELVSMQLPFCPSKSGCRTFLTTKDKKNLTTSDKWRTLTFHLKGALGASDADNVNVWIGSVFITSPNDVSHDTTSPEQVIDLTPTFLDQCAAADHFHIEADRDSFCDHAVFALSTAYNKGAQKCACNTSGTLDGQHKDCAKFGGQCACRENVIGRTCSKCRTGFYGFPNCQRCDCPTGNCDDKTGECVPSPNSDITNTCHDNYYDFQPIHGCISCNCDTTGTLSASKLCDKSASGQCTCRSNTSGRRCDKCNNGYHSFPECKPCDCPGKKSANVFANSCEIDPKTQKTLSCSCSTGYAGESCEECAPGYHGNPTEPDGKCKPCQCNENIKMSDPKACDQRSGKCLKCENNTTGDSCEICAAWYYGKATGPDRKCNSCTCDKCGTAECERGTGECKCKPNVVGERCDKCAANTWGLGSVKGECGEFKGCQACACDPIGSVSPQCDQLSGECKCKPGVGGKRCDACLSDHWQFTDAGCTKCNCWGEHVLRDSQSKTLCDATTGKCFCKEGFADDNTSQCGKCKHGHFSYPKCNMCDCMREGALEQVCDALTGDCKCKSNVTEKNCGKCPTDYFHMEARNPKGCSRCFCFNATNKCGSYDGLFYVNVSDMNAAHWSLAYSDAKLSIEDNGFIRVASEKTGIYLDYSTNASDSHERLVNNINNNKKYL